MSVPLQVTIDVVVDPQDELEVDLMAEPNNRWSESAPCWLPAEELFWPLSWGYSEGEEERPLLKGRASGEEKSIRIGIYCKTPNAIKTNNKMSILPPD